MPYRFRTSQILLAASLLALSGLALAQSTTPPTGAWSGAIKSDKSGRVRVDAAFDPSGSVDLHIGQPYGCHITAKFLENDKDGIYYAFGISQNGGGFCDKLYPGELVLTSVTASSFTLSLNNGDARWSGTLKTTP